MFILEQIENFLLRDEILNTLDENSRIENSEMQKYSHICIREYPASYFHLAIRHDDTHR